MIDLPDYILYVFWTTSVLAKRVKCLVGTGTLSRNSLFKKNFFVRLRLFEPCAIIMVRVLFHFRFLVISILMYNIHHITNQAYI